VKLFKNNERVTPTGANTTAGAAGQFYGAIRLDNGDLSPAEVGVVMHASGGDGIIFGTFIAD
jgi:hypothetical protein